MASSRHNNPRRVIFQRCPSVRSFPRIRYASIIIRRSSEWLCDAAYRSTVALPALIHHISTCLASKWKPRNFPRHPQRYIKFNTPLQ